MRLLLPLFLFIACSDFIKLTDSDYDEKFVDDKAAKFSIVFSHNINGETHPCGCRNFPLGGLSQVYGKVKDLKNKQPLIYVDSGDTFFDSPVISSFTKISSEFKARKIAEAMDLIGLDFMTPGDQDFAMGIDFLQDLTKKHQFEFLISNSRPGLTLKHKKKFTYQMGANRLIFLGVIDPNLLSAEWREFFTSPQAAIAKQLEQTKSEDVVILLSHGGLEEDKKLAKRFPQIRWIVGAHSQSFLTDFKTQGPVKLGQVLSRNHYLGHIQFNSQPEYELMEMRDEAKDLVKPNPMISWMDQYKTQLDSKYQEEQALFSVDNFSKKKLRTYLSCSQCHQEQTKFWQQTSHAIAFQTLIHAEASHNNECIKCHSLGLNKPNGFNSKKNIIVSKTKTFDHDQYWKEVANQMKITYPIREADPKQRQVASQNWIKVDEKMGITHNFSNVQCLNCHKQDEDHPNWGPTYTSKEDYQEKCLACHTQDQSPEWYDKNAKGLATKLNQQYFDEKFKEMGCPKLAK